jgi:aminomuconate-semialdehyde/2-hydroxymuconate-6-semialdehyde dehydrogenase
MTRALQNYAGGAWYDAASGATLENVSPATGEITATIPSSGPEDVDRAVGAAREALAGPWGRSTAAERADLLEAVAERITSRADELAALESLDTGKPVTLARNMDIARAIANFRFFAGAVRHDRTGAHEMSDALNYTLRRPLGVVGLVTPWNLPLYLLSWKTAPALATGNAVVAKPSELTPLSAGALAEILHDVGAPAGAFNLVHGLGAAAGAALVAHPGVAGISFTGGTATGARVGAAASSAFKKLSLELGGKNATLVFADADPAITLPGVLRASFTNQGQVCLCGSRILVERRYHDAFVAEFVRRVEALRLGDPADPATELGSLVSLAHRDKVESYVALARAEGGTVVTGGERPHLPDRLSGGAFYRPTVITGLSPASRVSQEEIFGPVVTVHPFDSDDEAIALANGVAYGLAASVWTNDLRRAHRVSAALDVGMVWVNTWLKRDLRVPFGGVKASGVGREGGDFSLEFYTNDKNVCIALGG